MSRFSLALAGYLLLSLLPPLAQAGDGHDHDAAPAAPAQPTLPRLAISGQQFELVGELSPGQLTLYVDWLASNAPAAGAQLQLRLNDQPLTVAETAPGTFVAAIAAHADEHDHDHDQPPAGELPLVATIALDQATEQLAGHFDLAVADHAERPQAHYGRWLAAVVALLVAGALVVLVRRRRAHGGGQ